MFRISHCSPREVDNKISCYNKSFLIKIANILNESPECDKIDIYLDHSLKRFKNLYAAAGHPYCVFKINFTELLKIKSAYKIITIPSILFQISTKTFLPLLL